MKLNLPTFKIHENAASEKNKNALSIKANFKFQPIYTDFKRSKLSQRIKDLICKGKGINNEYAGDESAAFFAACIAMVGIGFTNQEIASVLTDKENYLSGVSYRHTGNTNSREHATKWTIEQNLVKARKELSKKLLFESFDEPVYSDGKVNSEKKFKFEAFKDINFTHETSALVENLIGHESLVLVYGATNTGKTFATLDLAMHVAQGRVWQNRKVDKSAVLYIATEGGLGIKKRIAALKKAFALEHKELPLWFVSSAIDLSDPRADVNPLIQEIKKTEDENGVQIRLVIIDTLNRAYAGGDENSSADMGSFIKCIDLIRAETNSTVLIVHHSGKDRGQGARGHSSLKAAVDTEIEIEANKTTNTLIARATKQREYEFSDPMVFKFEQVEIGKNEDGLSVTSCVLRPLSIEASNLFSEKALSRTTMNALTALNEVSEVSSTKIPKSFNWPKNSILKLFDEWKVEFKSRYYKDKHRSTFHSAFAKAQKDLENANRIEVRENYVRIL